MYPICNFDHQLLAKISKLKVHIKYAKALNCQFIYFEEKEMKKPFISNFLRWENIRKKFCLTKLNIVWNIKDLVNFNHFNNKTLLGS